MFKPTYFLSFLSLILLALPLLALANNNEDPGLIGLINLALDIVNRLTLMAMALAFLFFLWGGAVFILQAGDQEGQKKGRSVMLWGVIALAVMTSVWGLVAIIQNSILGGSPVAPSSTFEWLF